MSAHRHVLECRARMQRIAVFSRLGASALCTGRCGFVLSALLMGVVFGGSDVHSAVGGEIEITIEPASQIDRIGIVRRFDENGLPVGRVDPRERFEQPHWDRFVRGATARFTDLPPGTYDVILMLRDGTRLEGFHWPPTLVLRNDRSANDRHASETEEEPPEAATERVRQAIRHMRRFENKVAPLAFGGDERTIVVLMQLVRDEKTSFDKQFGEPVAVARYELWTFRNRYGGWVRDRDTVILHRLLEGRSRFQTRRWLWDRRLGGLAVSEADDRPARLHYRLPKSLDSLPGWKPQR